MGMTAILLNAELNITERVEYILDIVEETLGDWAGIEPPYCPAEMQTLKLAQDERCHVGKTKGKQ